jgi:RND family efflux transporter MFP subunit
MKPITQYLLVPVILACSFSCKQKQPSHDIQQNKFVELPSSLKEKDFNPAYIYLTPEQQSGLNVSTSAVSRRIVQYALTAPGVVFPAPEHSSIISTPINGQISRIYRYEGTRVEKGMVLFQIQSLEFGNMVSEYMQAKAEERFQTNRINRLKQLVAESISSASEMERAAAEYERSTAIVRASYSKLKAIGVSDSEIVLLSESENITPMLSIHSPINGMVETNFVELGQSVNALQNLARVLDTHEVLVKGYLPPDDARLISPGDTAIIRISENQPIIVARVGSINPGMDENNKSVIVNIMVPTTGGWPKPGENIRLEIKTSSVRELISVPVEALTYDGHQPIVFVKKEDGVFEKRGITVAEIRDRIVFVSGGLSDKEDVAVSKVFSLKALSRFEQISGE